MKQKLGVLGSGQLGQMMCAEALPNGWEFYCYSPDKNSPSEKMGAKAFVGEYENLTLLDAFCDTVDVVSFEFENIPSLCLDFLEQKTKTKQIFPPPNALRIAQDRWLEKNHCKSLGLKTAEFSKLSLTSKEPPKFGFPWIIKTLRFGYDGKGQTKVTSETEWFEFLEKAFQNPLSEYLIESVIPFEKEISVILTRFQNGKSISYGAIENTHKNHILDLSVFPANIPTTIQQKLLDVTQQLAESLDYIGTLGVEFFLLGETFYVNEFAPRPHNTGHFTQNCGSYSQFFLHLAAISGAEPPVIFSPKPTLMKNILGDRYLDSVKTARFLCLDDRYHLHLYGKEEAKAKRKMGHLNFSGTLSEVDPKFFTI